ncbi:MAG: glycosyltransferase [Paludibacteraceae bacterium]|nr:glycosyltransferase [Paludibacteraceae bacterium]
MSTAVIILNYNNSSDTIACVKSVEAYNTADIKYIIVDNGSSKKNVVDEIADFLESTFSDVAILKDRIEEESICLPKVTFYMSSCNDGYAEGNNKGLRLAYLDDSIDDILILNSDILFVEDIIPELRAKQAAIANCGIVSPILYKKDMQGLDFNCARKNHTEWELILTYLFLYKDLFGFISKREAQRKILVADPNLANDELLPIDLPSGSCMLVSKELMKQIGGFDSGTFLYFEENILYKKISSLGKKNYLLPKSRCIHLGATSTQKVSGAFLLKCSLDSASHYLAQYCEMSGLQKVMWCIAQMLFGLKIRIVKLLR